MARTARKPCLFASAVFVALGCLIARLAVAPLGAADLLGVAACAAAAGAFATLAFALPVRAPGAVAATVAPALDPATLADLIAAGVDARLIASEDRRREEILRAARAARPEPVASAASSRAPLDADQIGAAGSGASKPRLGRGLASLIHNPSALAKSVAPESPDAPASEDRAAA